MNRTLVAAALVASALLTTACASSPEPAAAARSLPGGIGVAVYQTRSDVVARVLEVSVANASDRDVVITGAEFRSTQFTDAAVWQKEATTVRAGRTVDLPVDLPEASCDDPEPRPEVRLSYRIGSGDERTAVVTPTDERERLPELRGEECFEQSVAAVVGLRADTPVRTVTVAGRPAAQLDLSVVEAPDRADDATISVDSAAGTTLFTVIDPADGASTPELRIGITLPDPGLPVVTLTLVPNRCDPHAVAEDKRGSIFPLGVTSPDDASVTGRTSGVVYVAADPVVRESLIGFIGYACGTSG